MKNLFKLMLALSAVIAFSSCGSTGADPEESGNIVSEWHLISVSGLSSIPQVYVEFGTDLTFELYQKTGTETYYNKYEGTYSVASAVLSGKYSDGEKWGSDYKISFDDGKLVLTAQNGSEEVCTYENKALTETDKAEAILETKSLENGPRFL